MKAKDLLFILVAAALPSMASFAEDTGKSETTTEQVANEKSKSASGSDQLVANQNPSQTELDKLVAEMNSAPAEKRLDAITAVVNKLVEQFKVDEQSHREMPASEMSSTNMCKMMKGMNEKDNAKTENDHSSHDHH